MKNLCLMVCFMLPVFAIAQKVKLGVNAGANYTFIYNASDTDYYKPDIRYLIGLSAEVPLSERFSVNVGFNYERRVYIMR